MFPPAILSHDEYDKQPVDEPKKDHRYPRGKIYRQIQTEPVHKLPYGIQHRLDYSCQFNEKIVDPVAGSYEPGRDAIYQYGKISHPEY